MRRLILLILVGLLAACSSSPETRRSATASAPGVDFSGHWEMDYGRSDDVNRKLRLMQREWIRAAERRAQMDQRGSRVPTLSIDQSARGFRQIVAAARLADMITESQVLEITQDPNEIEVDRENNFALTCVFTTGAPEVVIDELGSEVCGWNGHELLFHVQLPDGVSILHRMRLAESGDRLRVSTTVDSGGAPPFTLNRFYFKFNPLPEDYRCEYTLSRGNVCQKGQS